MRIRCPYCDNPAVLSTGADLFPHLPELSIKRYWVCGPCDARVGCHAKGASVPVPGGRRQTSDGTLPLGRLANAELRQAKRAAHAAFDPIWRDGHMARTTAYASLARFLGVRLDECHIGEFDYWTCLEVVRFTKTIRMPASEP